MNVRTAHRRADVAHAQAVSRSIYAHKVALAGLRGRP